MLGVRSLSLPFSADHRSHFVCFFAAPILNTPTLQHSPLPAPCSPPAFDVRYSALGGWAVGRWAFVSPLSGVTTPPIHCFARDLLLCCFMTKSRCWPAHSR